MTAATNTPTQLIPQSQDSSKPPTFDDFWMAYPRRSGANPKAPARTSWDRALKQGAKPEAIIMAAQAFRLAPTTKVGTEFVPMAVTWLNQRRWEEYSGVLATVLEQPNTAPMIFVEADTEQWRAWARHLGKTPPINRQFGWYFPSEWPPGYQAEQELIHEFSGHVGLPLDSSVT